MRADQPEGGHEDVKASGHMAIFRVLGVRDNYLSSRPTGAGDVVLTYQDSPSSGDTTRVVLGSQPAGYIQAWRQAWAATLAAFSRSSEWNQLEDPSTRRDEICDELAAEVELPHGLQAHCGLWITVQVTRPCILTVSGTGRYYWARWQELDELDASFRSEVQEHLDLMIAGIEAASGLRPDVPVVVSDRALFFVDGRAPTALPTVTAGTGSISTTGVWEQLPMAAIDDRLASLSSLPKKIRESVAHASRWNLLAVDEDDELRAFLFAFVGIESLVASLRTQLLPTLVARLDATSPDQLPVADLIWPQPADTDDRPNRSALFNFAAVISVLSPQTASADTEVFRKLQRRRQDIAHGKDHDVDAFPAAQCRAMLVRLLSRALTFEWDTSA